jgi:hypothetical protein
VFWRPTGPGIPTWRLPHETSQPRWSNGLEARRAAKQGRQKEDIQAPAPREFDGAADEFVAWVKGEYKPSSAHRIATSFVPLKRFFGNSPVHTISSHQIEQYKTWRRASKITHVTVRTGALSGAILRAWPPESRLQNQPPYE